MKQMEKWLLMEKFWENFFMVLSLDFVHLMKLLVRDVDYWILD